MHRRSGPFPISRPASHISPVPFLLTGLLLALAHWLQLNAYSPNSPLRTPCNCLLDCGSPHIPPTQRLFPASGRLGQYHQLLLSDWHSVSGCIPLLLTSCPPQGSPSHPHEPEPVPVGPVGPQCVCAFSMNHQLLGGTGAVLGIIPFPPQHPTHKGNRNCIWSW